MNQRRLLIIGSVIVLIVAVLAGLSVLVQLSFENISSDFGSQPTQLTDIGQSSQPTRTNTPQATSTATPLVLDDPPPLPTPIGDGTFRVFAPDSVSRGETALIELELAFDELFFAELGDEPAPTPDIRATFTPVPLDDDTAPRRAVDGVGERGVPLYEQIGASLTCAPESFIGGCNQGVFLRDINPALGQENWTWILAPAENAEGAQNVIIETWLVAGQLPDGSPDYRRLGSPYRLSLDIRPAGGFNPAFLVVGAALILIAGAFGTVIYNTRRGKSSVWRDSPPPKVFISYRRGSSWSLARSLSNSLNERGADVFLDIDDINEGRFADIIEKAIEDSDYFIPILSHDTLDSYWCKREIQHALLHDKTIVPLLADGYKMDSVPPEIEALSSHNAITVLPEFYDAAVDRLAKRFLKLN